MRRPRAGNGSGHAGPRSGRRRRSRPRSRSRASPAVPSAGLWGPTARALAAALVLRWLAAFLRRRLAAARGLFLRRFLRWPQHRAAALGRAAAAGVDLVDVGRIVLVAADLVVVA